MQRHLGWRLAAVLVLLGAAGALVLTRPARLGLDLRGGTRVVLEARDSDRRQVDRGTVDRTLEGIAGFVLAIGMAVDANVLVFERAREEHREGSRRALDRGFAKALSAIADANVTTLLAAALLFFVATGAVRGFGVTVSVGVLVSMFTSLVVTRVLVDLAQARAALAEAGFPRAVVQRSGPANLTVRTGQLDAGAERRIEPAVAGLGRPLDGVFLAALLTVTGYSANDSVVVFDRIRERRRDPIRQPLPELANAAPPIDQGRPRASKPSSSTTEGKEQVAGAR